MSGFDADGYDADGHDADGYHPPPASGGGAGPDAPGYRPPGDQPGGYQPVAGRAALRLGWRSTAVRLGPVPAGGRADRISQLQRPGA